MPGVRWQGIRGFDLSKGFEEPAAFVLVHDLRDAPLAGVLLSTEASHGMIQMVKIANDYYPDMSVRHVFLFAPTLMSAPPPRIPCNPAVSALQSAPLGCITPDAVAVALRLFTFVAPFLFFLSFLTASNSRNATYSQLVDLLPRLRYPSSPQARSLPPSSLS